MTERKLSEREKAVRQAIHDLYKHGLKISGLQAHPETVYEMVNESLSVMTIKHAYATAPELTYCGLSVEQVL